MKRHPALAALSREHHQALAVAQRLKRSSEGNAEEARQSFLEYWGRDGAAHFREEEDVLLPALARFSDPDEPVVARVLIDHVRIGRSPWRPGSARRLNGCRRSGWRSRSMYAARSASSFRY